MAATFFMHQIERSARAPELEHQYFVCLSKFGLQQAIKLIFQLKRAGLAACQPRLRPRSRIALNARLLMDFNQSHEI